MDGKNSKKVVQFKIRTHNTLIRHIHEQRAELNGIPIQDNVFWSLLKAIIHKYPGCKVGETENYTIWEYPIESSQNTEEHIELENGTADAEAFTNWAEQQQQTTLDY